MKAVFIKQSCLPLLSESQDKPPDQSQQFEELSCLESLTEQQLFIVLMDCQRTLEGSVASASLDRTQTAISAVASAGGHVDALLRCPHPSETVCGCWDVHPGFLEAAAGQLDLRLNECFLICDEPRDVALAQESACRPILLLGNRTLGNLFGGHQPESPDFPVARNLSSAVAYISAEVNESSHLGHARQIPIREAEVEGDNISAKEYSPQLTLLSPLPGAQGTILAGIPQLSRQARQLLFLFVVGGVWLSLGIAYLLTHLYRVQQFPAFVWYLTLQFIPRPIRGLLFISTGLALVAVSLRAFMRLLPNGSRRR